MTTATLVCINCGHAIVSFTGHPYVRWCPDCGEYRYFDHSQEHPMEPNGTAPEPEVVPAPVDLPVSTAAMAAILTERLRQHELWGVQRHSWPEWLSILTEEVGEACQAANEAHWGTALNDDDRREKIDGIRYELTHVAAVSVAIIEHIDEVVGEGRS